MSGVFRGDLLRVARNRSYASGLVVALVAGLLVGGGAVALQTVFAATGSDLPPVSRVLPVEAAVTCAVLLAALATSARVAREQSDGTVVTSALLISDRVRLFVVRCLTAASLVSLVCGALSVVLLPISVAVLAEGLPVSPPDFVIVPLSMLAGFTMTVLSFSLATVFHRGPAAVLLLLVLTIVGPLAGLILALAAPAPFADIARTVVEVLPTPLLAKTLSVSGLADTGWLVILQGLGGLALWGVVGGLVAVSRFRRLEF